MLKIRGILIKGFDTLHATAISFFSTLNVNTEEELKQKRTKKLPSALKQSVLNSFVTRTADALQPTSQNEDIKNELWLDMYYPILDSLSSSLSTRFNDECVSSISNLSNLFIRAKFEKAVIDLAKIATTDIEKCFAEAKALFSNEACKKYDSLQSLMHIMIDKKYNFLYKTFYHLVTFLLTLPITSASCM